MQPDLCPASSCAPRATSSPTILTGAHTGQQVVGRTALSGRCRRAGALSAAKHVCGVSRNIGSLIAAAALCGIDWVAGKAEGAAKEYHDVLQ